MKFMEDVTQLAEEITKSNNFELVHIELVQDGKNFVLRLYLDKEGGITIEDCKLISRQMSYELDVEDLIPHAYTLEVSSPGIDRIMGKIDDYQKFAGEEIVIRLKQAFENRKKYRGKLIGITDDNANVIVQVDNKEYIIPYSLVKKANLKREIDF
jgi:ribosome maturation factor RimP